MNNLTDLSLNLFQLQPPKTTDENNYEFPILYNNNKNVLLSSNQIYLLHLKENNYEVHIKEKNELKFFNNLHKYLLELLYDNHDAWFESKFERNNFISMFKEYLYPNIEQNAVNIKCKIKEDLLENINKTSFIEFYPTFQLNSIMFNNQFFEIDLELVKIVEVNNTRLNENNEIKEEYSENLEQEEEEEEDTLKNCVLENNINLEENLEDLENNNEEKHLENNDSLNDLQEVNIKINNNEEYSINDDDYELIRNIIQSNISEHFSNSLLSLLQEKGINTQRIDMQNIVYDSDDDSDDEYNNNFEENYKNMV